MRVKIKKDNNITEQEFNYYCDMITNKLCNTDDNLTQQNIIKVLLNTNISYTTIARVINTFCNSKATSNSVASQIRLMERKGILKQDTGVNKYDKL